MLDKFWGKQIKRLKNETEEANKLKLEGKDDPKDREKWVKWYVENNLDALTAVASIDYQKKAKAEILKAVSDLDYEKAENLIKEVQKHQTQFNVDLKRYKGTEYDIK